ncbi:MULTISPECIES: NrsF family protein [Asticcacaulis]|uniref:NrsF family protein n=1 Tax=Asticcacaulis TaxID=76890 RepID=UPI001AE5CF9C|nr:MULTISPECIES: NrsF family protein [Asticcacaulis]MBP2157678.1 hypothetical protein [Asticcacaulis solisilvae]MDR6798723.1 hypothetical protein [Asticcacaulis sp. BE141]
MSDDILDHLARDLKPAKPLSVKALGIGAAVATVLAAVYIFVLYGARPELKALLGGDFSIDPMAWFKPLLFIAIGAGALWSVADLARPEGRLRLRTLAPLLIALGFVLVALVADLFARGFGAFRNIGDPSVLCVLTIVCGGGAGLILMWRLWLRRAATSHPGVLGAMSGLAAASLMAAAYAVHCDRDTPVYILGIYGGGVAIVTAVAAVLGRRLLRW